MEAVRDGSGMDRCQPAPTTGAVEPDCYRYAGIFGTTAASGRGPLASDGGRYAGICSTTAASGPWGQYTAATADAVPPLAAALAAAAAAALPAPADARC